MSDHDPLEAQRRRIADTERVRRAKLAALQRQPAPALPATRLPATRLPATRRSERPLDPVEAKRRAMAEALERKQSRQVTRPAAQRPRVVVLVKPNLRRLRQRGRGALAAKEPPPGPLPSAPALSAEDEISRRMREARARLLE